tara:strand:- start:48 stop:1241 length:1194 start_codon:yes stop_codon:yes gene_type:complete
MTEQNTDNEKSLRPNYQTVRVNPSEDLLLDPNNPRYFSDEREKVESEDFALSSIQDDAKAKMKRFHIEELQHSMIENGYVPTDAIFVTKHEPSGKYLVREGNRRTTAIMDLLLPSTEPECPPALHSQLSDIEVLEIISEDGDESDVERQIDYLLGVRHHGSLVPHTPFARAQNAYESYIEVSGQTDESFNWDDESGEKVAKQLSVDPKELKKSFKVFRAMQQLNDHDEIKEVGMQGRYYSLLAEVLTKNKTPLNAYLPQDPVTFLLEDEAVERIDRLCHFSKQNRGLGQGPGEEAPLSNPHEWRSLANILKDEDPIVRDENLAKVEEEKIKPSIVWAARSADIKKLDWSKWLQKATLTLSPVNAGQLLAAEGTEEYERAVEAVKKLHELIVRLKSTS